MLLGSLLSWWYGLGWVKLMQKVTGRMHKVMAFFSVGMLLGSLFAPFRQISAGRPIQGTVQAQLAAWGDRLFSRLIGAVVRLMLVFAGLVSALIVGVIGVVLLVAWPFIPALPIIGVFLMQVRAG